MLDRAGRLTPGGLRAAIARAVMEAAPDKARKRRETAAKFARVERWAEDSGNAALAGRELSPDQVLAADERITARARELKAAGLDGGTDELRARALLDLLLGQDSRPRSPQPPAPARHARPARPGTGRVRQPGHADRPAGHLDPPGRPARRAIRPRPGRPLADPRPGRRRRAEPEDHLVPDRHRRPGPRHRPRLRPARTQESQETRRPRPARRHRVLLHPGQPGRAARRVRYLAAAHPRPRTGPDHHDRPGHHRPLRPPARNQRPRSRGQAAAPGPGPARHLHQPRLPPPRRPVRPTSTTSRTKQAAAPVSATPARSAATTTGSSSTPSGRSTSFPTAPSDGPPRPGGPTPPNPPATRSNPPAPRGPGNSRVTQCWVCGTDSIRNMDEVDHPGRYRPYLWRIWSWPVTSTSAT